MHNGYLFALPERDAEGRRVIFSVARLDTKTMIIFDNKNNDSDDDGGLVVRRNLDPTRHTNSDALKAHIITFEVTSTSLIAHFFRSLAHKTILDLDCCWK